MEDKMMKNPIEALFDENNIDPISLFNEKGDEVKFEQVAIIPRGEDVYAILKPVEKTEGIEDDEALVFKIELEEELSDEGYLSLVSDVDLIDEVFEAYNKLFEEEAKRAKKEAKKKK